jgi:hypothetical protein
LMNVNQIYYSLKVSVIQFRLFNLMVFFIQIKTIIMAQTITLTVPSNLPSDASQADIDLLCTFSGGNTKQEGKSTVNDASQALTTAIAGELITWVGQSDSGATVDICWIRHSVDSTFTTVGSGTPKTISVKVQENVNINDKDTYKIWFHLSTWGGPNPGGGPMVEIDPKIRIIAS